MSKPVPTIPVVKNGGYMYIDESDLADSHVVYGGEIVSMSIQDPVVTAPSPKSFTAIETVLVKVRGGRILRINKGDFDSSIHKAAQESDIPEPVEEQEVVVPDDDEFDIDAEMAKHKTKPKLAEFALDEYGIELAPDDMTRTQMKHAIRAAHEESEGG